MEFHGIFSHGNAWTNFLSIPWKFSMEFHGNQRPNSPWNSMEDFPWNSMEFHDGGISHGLVQIMYNNAY